MFDGSETAFNGISWIKRDDRGRTTGLGWVDMYSLSVDFNFWLRNRLTNFGETY